jgi:hypothetical protein
MATTDTPAKKPPAYITPAATLSYPALFEPKTMQGSDKPKYSASLVFPPGTDLKQMQRLAQEAATEKFGDKWPALHRAGRFRFPFRTDGEEKGYAKGSVFINAKSDTKPGVVGPMAGADGKPVPIDDEDDMYPGCIVRASITFFAYDQQGNKGVGVGLNNIQKMRDGKRLDGRRAASDEFDPIEEAAFEDASDPML